MRRGICDKVPDEALYYYFMSVGVSLSLGRNIVGAMFDNIETVQNKKLKALLLSVRDDMLICGTPFTDAFETHEKQLPSAVFAMLCIGETTGSMPVITKGIITYLRTKVETSRTIKAELAYPLLILAVLAVFTVTAVATILPMLSGFIPGLDVSAFIKTAVVVPAVFAALTLLFLLVRYIHGKSYAFAYYTDALRLSLPFFGKLEKAYITSQSATCIDIMMRSHMSGLMIYDLLIRTVQNRYVRERLFETEKELREGVPIDKCLKDTKGFSDFFYSVPIVSETVSEGLTPAGICAEIAQAELKRRSRVLSGMIQPLMLLLIGGVVIWLIASVFIPYLESFRNVLNI